jgi:branched-chain amino acid transport system permease protein
MADLLQTLVAAVTIGSLYALIALGYTMVYGILKLINFAHSDVVVLGAWSSLTIATFLLPRLGVDLAHPTWWSGILVLLLAMLTCAIAGLLIERLAYRPIRHAPRLNALITAIGVSLLMSNAGQLQYTLIDGRTDVAAGMVTGRGTDPKTILLDQPITITAGGHYVLKLQAKGGSAVDRTVIAPPGAYRAGEPIATNDTIGRAQTRDATFALQKIATPLKLPFGVMPAAAPQLLPVVTHAGDPLLQNVVYYKKFDRTVTLPDGTTRTLQQPLQIRLVHVIVLATTAVLLVGLELLIFHTRFGTAMRATSFNNELAALMGVPVDRVIATTFVIGAVLAAAAGFLYGQTYSPLQQTAHYAWALLCIKAFVAAVVGGIGNVRGAVVGGFLIAFIEQFGSVYGTKVFADASAYADVVVFVLLIAVLLIKPSGLFGSAAAEKI